MQSEMREDSWPRSGGGGASTFAIVLKDRTVRSASALSWQDSVLTYVAPDAASRANSRDLLQ